VESREFAPDYAFRVQATRYDRLSQKHDEKWQWPYQIYRRDITARAFRAHSRGRAGFRHRLPCDVRDLRRGAPPPDVPAAQYRLPADMYHTGREPLPHLCAGPGVVPPGWSRDPCQSRLVIRSRAGRSVDEGCCTLQPKPQEEPPMTMPGFTSEAALFRTRNRYYVAGYPNILAGDGQISPQFVLPPPCTCPYVECHGYLCRVVCYCRPLIPISSTPSGILTPD